MNNKELEKVTAVFGIGNERTRGIVIKCTFGKNFYNGGKKNTLTCATKLRYRKFAEYLKQILEEYWDSNQKIIRFYKNPKSAKVITDFCELHDPKELKKLYQLSKNKNKQSKKKNKNKINNNKNKGDEQMTKNNKNNEAVAAFEINTNKNVKRTYSIKCIMIEQGKVNTLKCVTNIPDKKTAKFLHKMLEKYWDTHNKILRYYDNPDNASIKITKYCEIRPLVELETIVEQYSKRKKPKEIINNNKEFERINKIIKESNKKIEEITQSIKELSQNIKELEQ